MSIYAAFRVVFLTSLILVVCPQIRAEGDGDGLDSVVLNDGTEIPCLVVSTTDKGVVIAEADDKDPEKIVTRTLARSTIRTIVLGQKCERTQQVMNDAELDGKVVFSKTAQKADAAENATASANDDGSKHNGMKKNGDSVAIADTPPTGVPPTEPAVETLSSKELIGAYADRYPELKDAALNFAGTQRLQEWLDDARVGNIAARRPVEGILKAFLGTASNADKVAPVRGVPPSRLPTK